MIEKSREDLFQVVPVPGHIVQRDPGDVTGFPFYVIFSGFLAFVFTIFDSTSWMARMVLIKLSGVTEMLSMPSSTRNWAKSGKSEGPCPQMPTLTPHFLAVRMSMRSKVLTASFRSS